MAAKKFLSNDGLNTLVSNIKTYIANSIESHGHTFSGTQATLATASNHKHSVTISASLSGTVLTITCTEQNAGAKNTTYTPAGTID